MEETDFVSDWAMALLVLFVSGGLFCKMKENEKIVFFKKTRKRRKKKKTISSLLFHDVTLLFFKILKIDMNIKKVKKKKKKPTGLIGEI